MSIQHKFDGKLTRQKKHTQDFTSLSLFRDEFECLLRDLYGDVESEVLNSIVLAGFIIAEALTKYMRPDLWKEHDDAKDFDYILSGISETEYCGIGSSDYHRGMKAKFNLFRRVREVNANPSDFSDYTREFAKLFAERWGSSPRSRVGTQISWDAVIVTVGPRPLAARPDRRARRRDAPPLCERDKVLLARAASLIVRTEQLHVRRPSKKNRAQTSCPPRCGHARRFSPCAVSREGLFTGQCTGKALKTMENRIWRWWRRPPLLGQLPIAGAAAPQAQRRGPRARVPDRRRGRPPDHCRR